MNFSIAILSYASSSSSSSFTDDDNDDLFFHIVDAVKNHNDYFIQQRDAVGRLGLSTFQKITATLRMLAYVLPSNSTAVECIRRFCHAVVEVFAEQYLRSPTANDVTRLQHIGKQRCFPRILGNLDCMHLRWKKLGSPTIILKTIADYDIWIWYAYFGMSGSNNDINILEASHLFSNIAKADDTYTKWSTIVQTINDPHAPTHFLKKSDLHGVMTVCIIIHNMIVEDEGNLYEPIQDAMEALTPNIEIMDKQSHIVLRNVLIDHLWDEYSNSEN
ncbi:hypothetical protein Pfo_022587 [Paulownia fortunei]|nr:hypothetical protein Pfo_022587 [Paulownia fortunei]